MKYIDEFRDKKIVQALLRDIYRLAKKRFNLMEVCGTHTMTIFRSGIRYMLPENITLISGPGCPVCVTAQKDIDRMLRLAQNKQVIITTFGDMLKVPGTCSSLEKQRGNGFDIRIVYSPLEALDIARKEENKQIIFLAVGFETTAPSVAACVKDAYRERIKNFSIYCCHKLIPPAMLALLENHQIRIDGFICPGHVSTIIGTKPYERIVQEFKVPCVISGFEPTDILESILMILEQKQQNNPGVKIQYSRVVNPEGNLTAIKLIKEVFDIDAAIWRGLGIIPQSGLRLKDKFKIFDAERKFSLRVVKSSEPKNCCCGEILCGIKTPPQCPLFGKICNPEHPIGPCMVSTEGACSAWYKYKH
ncbi:MAG: hydrogenase formation protein HypD [Candidatus Omnitrophica bacterium]|nr:hydrogenase formation protein HypD [Candidatus Omnitrophota bacterium]